MPRVLSLLIVVSCLIEVSIGGSLIALAVLSKVHPLLPPVLAISGPGEQTPFLPYLLALPFFALAVLHLLILRWIRDEKEEGHHLLHLYGATVFIGGILAFLALGQSALGWAYLILGGLRGILLAAVSSVVMLSPSTVSALGLPGGRARRSAPQQRGSERTRRDPRRRSRSSRVPGGSPDRGRDEAVAGHGETRSRRPARSSERPDRSERPEGEEVPRQRRSRRSPERDRSRSEERPRSRRSRPRRTRDEETPAEFDQPTRQREESPSQRPQRPQRPRRSRDSQREGIDPRESPRPSAEPSIGVRPLQESPKGDSGEERLPDRAAEASAELIEPADFVGSRRRKQGRYSTGALFRPRGRRTRQPLGGDKARQGGDEWVAPEGDSGNGDPERDSREREPRQGEGNGEPGD